MASQLERSLSPQIGLGLTSGVDYFQRAGKGRNVAVNPAAATIKDVDVKASDSGFRSTGGEAGFDTAAGQAGTSPGGAISPSQAQAMGYAGNVTSQVGGYLGDPALGYGGAMLGSAAAASQGNFGPMAGTVASMMGASPLGATVAGLGVSGLSTGGVSPAQAVNAGLGLVGGPAVSAANLGLVGLTGIFGDMPVSFGDIAANVNQGYNNFGNVGPVDATQGQMAINNSVNPAATQAAVLGTPFGNNPQALEDAAYALGVANNTGVAPGMGVNSQGQTVSNANTIGAQDFGTFGVSNPGLAAVTGMDTNAFGQTVSNFGSIAAQDSVNFGASSGIGMGDPSAGMGGATEGSAGSTAATAGSPDGPDGANAGSMGGNSDGSSGAGDSTGNSSGGGVGADGWKDGGYIGETPGITKRYMDGGPVQGGPMLSMGYAQGGQINAMGGSPTPGIVNKRVDAMLRDPRMRQRMLARPQQLMASGELTPDEVTTMARVAEASLYNPSLYPQLRQFVVQQGMAPLPPTFDQEVIVRIMAVARGLQQATPPGQVPGTAQAQMQRPVPGAGNGGYLQGPGTGRSDSIGTINESTGEPVKVANGEYVIPAHVVRAKGRDFFDNLLRRYTNVPQGE
jgi:hypothetical protein